MRLRPTQECAPLWVSALMWCWPGAVPLLPEAGEVRVLNRASLTPVKTIFVGGVPRNVVFSSDGTALVANEQAIVLSSRAAMATGRATITLPGIVGPP